MPVTFRPDGVFCCDIRRMVKACVYLAEDMTLEKQAHPFGFLSGAGGVLVGVV